MTSLLTLQQDKPYRRLLHIFPGLLLVTLLTLVILLLARHPIVSGWGFGSLTLAIVGGIVIGNTAYPRLHRVCDQGVQWSKHHLLRFGIILYGFHLSLQHLTALGLAGLLIDALVLTSTFLLACYLGRKVFGLDDTTCYLIGAGSSICGAAAVLATAPTVKANGDSVAVAVATVMVFGTLAMFFYPWLYQLNLYQDIFPFTPQTFGVFIGSTVHEVAQVVAAGHSIAPQVENTAVIGKMLRVMLLAPFLLLLGSYLKRRNAETAAASTPVVFPVFALGFVLVTAFNTLHLLPVSLLAWLNQLDNLLLAMAMCALGLTTHWGALYRAGVKPLLLALLLFIWLVLGGGAINLAVNALLAA